MKKYYTIQPKGKGLEQNFMEVKSQEEAIDKVETKETLDLRDEIIENSKHTCYGCLLNNCSFEINEVDEKANLIKKHKSFSIDDLNNDNIEILPNDLESGKNYIVVNDHLEGSFEGIFIGIDKEFDINQVKLIVYKTINNEYLIYDIKYKDSIELESFDDFNNEGWVEFQYFEKPKNEIFIVISNENETKNIQLNVPSDKLLMLMNEEKLKLEDLIRETKNKNKIEKLHERLKDIENGINTNNIIIYDNEEFELMYKKSN